MASCTQLACSGSIEDGYCDRCGLPPARPASQLAPGALLGARTVTAVLRGGDVVAHARDGVATRMIAGTPAPAIAAERTALERLGGRAGFPVLLEAGEDVAHGPFLVVASPPADARPLLEWSRGAAPARVFAVLDAVLDAAEAAEAHGLVWHPLPGDFLVARGGALVLTRARGARRLVPGERVDGRAVLEAAGAGLLPEPAVRGSAALIRMLRPQRTTRPGLPRPVAELRATLTDAAAVAAAPHDGARVAAVTDPGLRRPRNEDAAAVASGEHRGEPWSVLVVCDGVSSSSHAAQAATTAADVTRAALAHFARSGDIARDAGAGAVAAAIRAAHTAVCAQPTSDTAGEPPGTTIVAALVYRRTVTVGWVGDSRAYWVSPAGAELLTRDHSWVNEAIDRGELTEEQALREPMAHAITRCLGPLEVGDTLAQITPDVKVRELRGPGHVVLCTDGLWNYFPHARDVAALLLTAGPDAAPPAIARVLVNHALVRGGQDNVAVAVHAHR